MESLKLDLKLLLLGKAVDEGPVDFDGTEEFKPINRKSVSYVVCGIVIHHNEVLMIQEAHETRAGKWYLPTGWLQSNETLQEGVKRKMLEETGLQFEPTSLLCVEVIKGHWFRFSFTGKVTGGTIKTLAEKDSKSLQAKWCPLEEVKRGNPDLPLRGSDILPLLDRAIKHKDNLHPVLPVLNPHKKLLLRVVFVNYCGHKAKFLYGKKPGPHLPQVSLGPHVMSMQVPICNLLQIIYGQSVQTRTTHGIISVEHNGKPAKEHDGMCITILVSIADSEGKAPKVANENQYDWHTISSLDLGLALTNRLQKCIPLVDVVHGQGSNVQEVGLGVFEQQLQLLLDGKAIREGPVDICSNAEFVPITKDTVTYVVCAVLFNDKGEVLLMQEAKSDRLGRWYLPAGKVEPNETLQESVQREVLEETGLRFEPTTLLSVQVAGDLWSRFTFIGRITGGQLKDLTKRDKESLQAKWFPLSEVRRRNPNLPLRSMDMLPIIERAVQHRQSEIKPHPVLPVISPHERFLLKAIFICRNRENVHVLYGKKNCVHFPQITLSPGITTVKTPISILTQEVFGSVTEVSPNIHGVLSVEYDGKLAKKHDGICITILVSVNCSNNRAPQVENNESYDWHTINCKDLCTLISKRQTRCIPLVE